MCSSIFSTKILQLQPLVSTGKSYHDTGKFLQQTHKIASLSEETWLLNSSKMPSLKEPWNHRMVWVRRDVTVHLIPIPAMDWNIFHYTKLLQALINLVLNTPRDETCAMDMSHSHCESQMHGSFPLDMTTKLLGDFMPLASLTY